MRTSLMSSGAVHFSTKGEYGVRLMVELARHHGEGPVSLAEVAEHEDLPRPYLEQLVVSLREAGLVCSTRGAHGGYELARAPEQIRMGEVLRVLEGPLMPMICAVDDPEHDSLCGRTSFCSVNTLWVRVRDAIASALDSLTLADLAQPKGGAPAGMHLVQANPGPALGGLYPAQSTAGSGLAGVHPAHANGTTPAGVPPVPQPSIA